MQPVDVTAARAVGPRRLHVTFDDGSLGTVDLTDRVQWCGLLAELRADPSLFAQVQVDAERGVVCWPNGTDLDSDLLHAWVHGREVPSWADDGEPGDG